METRKDKNIVSVFDLAQSQSSLSSVINERLDWAIEVCFIILFGFMPFAFGAVQPWSQQLVVILSAAIIGCFLLGRLLNPHYKIVFSWAYIPIVIFILLAVFSIIPMPASIISILSPQTFLLKAEMLYGSDVAIDKIKSMTLSFYPYQTKEGLRIVIAAAAVFFVAVNFYRSSERIRRLLKTIVVVGLAVGVIAVIQDLIGNGKIYFIVNSPLKANSGTFINHSHFGQFINLSIGAAIGLVMLRLLTDFDPKENSPAQVFEYFESPKSRQLWFLVAMISVCAGAMFASLTRGGMLSMLCAMAFTVILAAARRPFRKHGWIVIIVALVALLCVLYIGFDSVYDRFATIGNLDSYQTRLQVMKDLAQPIRKFAIWGSGLGSHDVVYPMFQSINTALRFSHAENEYLQLAEEMGLLGFVTMVCFAVIIGIHFCRAIRNKDRKINVVVYGLGFGIIAILVHSLSDFGQHLPANAFLTTVFCALIVALGKKSKSHKLKSKNKNRYVLIAVRGIGLVFAIAVFGWAYAGANDARIADENWKIAKGIRNSIKDDKKISDTKEHERKLKNIVRYVEIAVEKQPENVRYVQWLSVYEWQYVSTMMDSQTGILSDEGFGIVYKIVDDLKQARFSAPTFGPTYCMLGQLQEFVIFEPAGVDNIRKGLLLEPNDEVTTFAAGALYYSEDKIEESYEMFSKSVSLGGTFFKDMVRIYLQNENLIPKAIDLAADNIGRLRFIYGTLQDRGLESHAEKCYLKLIEALEMASSRGQITAKQFAELGNHYHQQNDAEKAITYYQRALSLDYGNLWWRMKLANIMADNGLVEQAMQQCRICLRLKPQFYRAKETLKELSLRPEIIEKQLK